MNRGWAEAPATDNGTRVGRDVEAASDYTAIQGEDSLADDPMPTPGDDDRPAGAARGD
ncbi:MAG: hypothetical protein KC438_01270 [Thermomicrobiales bacterium]|nr:hypothetical protein [Thermomicrobiales bacterium]MCO5223342.1 hypothetical protein [Thermomicrobiales bacterium]